jgi:Asp-tRNA(Asn)/Glu-tRNA(Gln) amidotransferase A subunit family amidase
MDINAWEGRWPLNTYARDIDRSGLSRPSQERLVKAESMTQEQYQALLVERARIRAVHAALRDRYDACIALPATGAAPLGLGSTGDPIFVVPASLLGTPSMSLPVLQAEGLPLGLQVIGFMNDDAALFSAVAAMLPIVER